MSYKIFTEKRKATECRDIWTKNGKKIYLSTFFRYGYAVVKKKPKIPKFDEEVGLNVTAFGEIESHSLDDGFSVELIINSEIPDDEREQIEAAWEEDGEDGLCNLGWSLDDWDIVFYGPVKVEKYGK